MRTRMMPVFDRFIPSDWQRPAAYYIVSGEDTATLSRLAAHGFTLHPRQAFENEMERFVIDSVTRAARPFQGHREARVWGRWVPDSSPSMRRPIEVNADPSKLRLLTYLLDPRSDDGFATWDLFAAPLSAGSYPVLRHRLYSIVPD